MKCLNVGEPQVAARARRAAFSPVRNILAAAVTAAAGFASSAACALGLGDLQSQTFLGQPLNARVELVNINSDLNPDFIRVRHILPAEAQKMGADVFYGSHQFDIQIDQSGRQPFVSIRTRDSVKEPYISVLLELTWPTGVVYREYPILLDPAPIVAPPSSRQPAAAQQPASTRAVSVPQRSAPVDARNITLRALQTDKGKYTVQSGDTLSAIAERWREGSDMSIQDTSQWLFENNPRAFINNDINRLIAGATLTMPALNRVSVAPEAPASVSPPANVTTADGPGAGSRASVSEAPAAQTAEAPSREGDAVLSEDVQGLLTVGARESNERSRELIDMLTRENQMLRERMEKVEGSEYLTTMRELVLLQQEQIKQMQKQLGEAPPQSEETRQMLEQIGLDQPADFARASTSAAQGKKTESLQEALTGTVAPDGQIAAQEDTPLVELDPSSADLLGEQGKDRTRLISLLLIAGGLLLAIFAGMYFYFRRMTSTAREEEAPLAAAGGPRNIPLAPVSRQPKPKQAEKEMSADDIVDMHLSDHTVIEPVKSRHQKEERWHDDKVGDDTQDDDYDAFAGLDLDEELLGAVDDGVEDKTLEALTQELPREKPPRRSDDEVKSSIAQKMAQYRTEEGGDKYDEFAALELDELEHFEGSNYDDVDTVVYRAMMYCEFRKFDKARHLLEVKMETDTDVRLQEALEQVEALQLDAVKKDAASKGQ